MFRRDDLRELAAHQSETPILSVYLDVDPTAHTTDEYKLELRQILKHAEEHVNPQDLAAVERFFDHEYDWSGRGVVVFSGDRSGFWRTYSLPFPITSGATVARKPYIWPLAALVDAYGSFMVAQVDRQEVQLLFYEMGELQTTERYEGEEVRKLKKGRGSSGGPGRRGGAPISSRREEEVAQRNIREAVRVTERFWRKHDPQRIIIASTEPTYTQFRDTLPKAMQEKIIGHFNAQMTAAEPEIRERSLEILQEVEREREAALVEAVFTAAAKGRGGVIRLADTLGAAHEGRIQTLVIARDYHKAGYQCRNCAYITDQPLETCPFCGGTFDEITDAAEALVTKVIEDGGKVEVVDDHPKIAEFGVGALLRY
jgi:peptide subunit release factor 1 (eRF1)